MEATRGVELELIGMAFFSNSNTMSDGTLCV